MTSKQFAALLLTLVATAGSGYAAGKVDHHSQQSKFEQAFRACETNTAYIGETEEDNRQLFVQCLDDYKSAPETVKKAIQKSWNCDLEDTEWICRW